FRKGVYKFADILTKEINEFERLFDALDVEYKKTFAELQTMFTQSAQEKKSSAKESKVKTPALETALSQLKAQLASAHIQLNSYKAENKTLSQRYEELAKSNMASRVQLSGRMTALTTENATLKAKVMGKQNSGSKSLAKPKVTATGMNWKPVNRKTTTIKQVFQPVKQVVTPVKKVWKATGKVLHVEHSSSVSTSVDVVVSSRFADVPITCYQRQGRKAIPVSVVYEKILV
nr:hypothetical protein [Tanacetum cinerariifolium]